jgi:hypothetical protein
MAVMAVMSAREATEVDATLLPALAQRSDDSRRLPCDAVRSLSAHLPERLPDMSGGA